MDNLSLADFFLTVEDLNLVNHIAASNNICASVVPDKVYLYKTDRDMSFLDEISLQLESAPFLSAEKAGTKSYLFPVIVEKLGRCITYPEFLLTYKDCENNRYVFSIDQIDRFQSYIRNDKEAKSPISIIRHNRCIISSMPVDYDDIEKIIKKDNIAHFSHREIYISDKEVLING